MTSSGSIDHSGLRENVERRRDAVTPRAINSLKTFRDGSLALHVGAVLAGVGIWVGSYVLLLGGLGWIEAASLETGRGHMVRLVGLTGATVVTSAYYLWLYTRAIGSPAWNVLSPLFIALGVPTPLLALEWVDHAPYYNEHSLYVFLPFVAYAIVFGLIYHYHYWMRFDSYAERVAWELEHLPEGLLLWGLFDEEHAEGSTGDELLTDRETRRQMAEFWGMTSVQAYILFVVRVGTGIFLGLLPAFFIITVVRFGVGPEPATILIRSAQTWFLGALVMYMLAEQWFRFSYRTTDS